MANVKTSRVVLIMSAIALVAGSLMASIKLSGFPMFVLLVPGLVAAYYQCKKNVRFEKQQRKRISAWYVGLNSVLGSIHLSVRVYETIDQIQEPLLPVVGALVFAIVTLTFLAYFIVYGVMGMDYVSK